MKEKDSNDEKIEKERKISSSSSSSGDEISEEEIPRKPQNELSKNKNKIITEEKKDINKNDKTSSEKEKTEKTFGQKFMDYFFGSKPKIEKSENPLAEDEKKPLEEIISSKGFQFQKHLVKTEDGYTLVLFRIPGGKKCKDGSKLPPVLLQHGVFDSSDGWVCNGEAHSIPFVLAKHNFDVWLSNSRGNKYCKEHDQYDVNSFEFWQYSFHELGLYDVPAVIKYIRKINKSGEKIIYFGHSQGTSLMFSGLTQKFDFYKENVKLFVALAPVARLSNLGSTLLSILSAVSFHKLMKKSKIYEICPNNENTNKLMNFMEKNANSLTNFFLGLISDDNSLECNDQNSLAVYLNHYPCGTSLKCLIHYVQIIQQKKFTYFDYKKEANWALYHRKTPPEYDLSVIKNFPIMLIGGEKDKLANPEDIKWLNLELKNNVIYFKIVPNMGHLSFMCGKDFSWFDKPLNIILEKYYPK